MSMNMNPLPHGIDITAPGGIEKLLAFHFQTFGNAQMNAGGDSGTGGEGGSGDGGAAGDNATGGQGGAGPEGGDGAGAGTGTQATGSNGTQGTAEPKPPWGDDFDPERAWTLIQNVRKDLETEKSKRESAINDAIAKATAETKDSFTQDIAKALGLVEEGNQDPAKVLETVTAERDTLTGERDDWKNKALDAQRQLSVFTAASTHGADPNKLLDSLSFMSKVKEIDPASNDFATQVAEAVKSAVDADKSLRVQAAAPRGGGDFSGGNNGGGTQLSREDLANMTPAQILQANKEGRLKSLTTPRGN